MNSEEASANTDCALRINFIFSSFLDLTKHLGLLYPLHKMCAFRKTKLYFFKGQMSLSGAVGPPRKHNGKNSGMS